MKKKSKKILAVFGWSLLFILLELGLLLGETLPWAQKTFGGVSAEEILFHLKVPLQGTDTTTIYSFVREALMPSLAEFFVLFGIFFLNQKKRLRFFKITACLLGIFSVVLFSLNLYRFGKAYSIVDYIERQFTSSTWIEKQYVEPEDALLSWPEKKRNLIYIFLESMEASYTSKENGGAFEEDLIPELTKLALQNTSFSSTDKKPGGASSIAYTTWTMAGMFAQTAGLPLKLPIAGNSMSEYSTFLPSVVSLGNLLEASGYHNCLMLGSDVVFGGRKNYFEQHGSYEILDYNWALEAGVIPEDYHVFWGMEDKRLLDAAKDKLLELSQQDVPFNLTMLTVDTHFPDGYRCDLCQYEHDSDYKDAISCSSRQIADFVQWIQAQDFYEDTAIVLVGDHLTMATELDDDFIDYDRHIYNCLINPAVSCVQETNRQFTALDMFPTTLAALGVTIEGDRLALGTNLFGSRQTLTEEFGLEYEDTELRNYSAFYNNHFIYH